MAIVTKVLSKVAQSQSYTVPCQDSWGAVSVAAVLLQVLRIAELQK